MKRIFTIIVSALALVVLGHTASFSQVFLGPRLGLNLSTLVGEDISGDDKTLNLGIQVGVTSQIPICESFDFQPELLYSQQGLRYAGETAGTKWSNSMNTGYLQVPLLFRMNFGSSDGVSFFVNAGPGIGFWMCAKSVSKFDGDKDTDKYEFDSDIDNRLDVNVSAGGGASIPLGPGRIFADVRYMFGFLGVNKDLEIESTPFFTYEYNPARNSVFTIGLGYVIPICGGGEE